MKYVWMAAFILTIFMANWAVETWGVVPVGFGLHAPAAVYFVGLAFTCRDMVHRTWGVKGAFAAVLIGSAISFGVAPQFAIASGTAFLFSETADLLVYDRIRKSSWAWGVAASNTVGSVVDSFIFLWLAFGSLSFLAGQLVGKMWMTVLAMAFIWLYVERHAIVSSAELVKHGDNG